MSKIKKFGDTKVKKLTGGKDPIKLVREFISEIGADPDQCLTEHDNDSYRWAVELEEDVILEVLLEGVKKPAETTVYMGMNMATVPVKGGYEFLVAALEVADGLVGVKISLVGHFLVMSATLSLVGLSKEEMQYHFVLIKEQVLWFQEAMLNELELEELPDY